MKAAIYIRVSTIEQAKEGYSVSGQKKRLTEFVNSQGWEIYDYYIDDGYSAKNLERPNMQRMIEDVKAKKFDIVLVYKLDRLVRSMMDMHTLLDLFERYDVKFKSATEIFETHTAVGKLFINIVGAMAEFERNQIAERVKFGMTEKLYKGERNGAVAPYGYDLKDGKLVVNKDEAKIVRRIFDMYRTTGAKGIAVQLNREGIKKGDGFWSYNVVMYILTNPVYTGKLRWNYRKLSGKRTGEEIIVDADHEPIIDEETFENARKIRESRQKEGKQATSDYPFTGVLRCGRCGYAMTGGSKKRKNGRYRFYRCLGRFQYGMCDMPIIAEKSVEEAFLRGLVWKVDDLEVAVTQEPDDDPREELEAELKSIQKRKEKWQYAYANEAISLDDLKRLTEQENKREEELKKKLMELPDKEKWTADEAAQLITELQDNWDNHNNHYKKEFIKEIFSVIEINTEVTEAKGGPGRKVPVEITRYELNL